MLWIGISKKRSSYLISDFSGFGKEYSKSWGPWNGQNHLTCPQGAKLSVPGLCCLSRWPPGHQASLYRESRQGHGQPAWDLTSSSLAAGDVYAHAETTEVSDALFPWNRELAGGHLSTRTAADGRVIAVTWGRPSSQGQALLRGKHIWGILSATPNVVFPVMSTSSSWTNKCLSAKRPILGEGTEAFFQVCCRGSQDVMTTTLTLWITCLSCSASLIHLIRVSTVSLDCGDSCDPH